MRIIRIIGLGLLTFLVHGETITSSLTCDHGPSQPSPSQTLPALPPQSKADEVQKLLQATEPLSNYLYNQGSHDHSTHGAGTSSSSNHLEVVNEPKTRRWVVNEQNHQTQEVYDQEGHLHQKQRWVDQNGKKHETDNWHDKDGRVNQCHKWEDNDGCVHESHQITDSDGTVVKKHLKKDANGIVQSVDDQIVSENSYIRTEQIEEHHHHTPAPDATQAPAPSVGKIRHAPNCPAAHLQQND